MWREIIIICFIVIIIFSANFIILNLLKDSTKELEEILEQVISKLDNVEESKQEIYNFNEKWDQISKIWATIVSHQELDQIEISIISAKKAIENEDKDNAVIELGKLEFLLKHIIEKEALLLKNIF